MCAVLSFAACKKAPDVQAPAPAVEETEVVEAAEEVSEEELEKIDLEDGEYIANFDTDSSMFHVNETCAGKYSYRVDLKKYS